MKQTNKTPKQQTKHSKDSAGIFVVFEMCNWCRVRSLDGSANTRMWRHASFSIFCCFTDGGVSSLEKSRWGPNPEEFQRRFDPALTNGEGPQRLRNLYFLYLLELRALAKAAPFIEQLDFYTGNATEDAEVYAAVHDLLHHVKYSIPLFILC